MNILHIIKGIDPEDILIFLFILEMLSKLIKTIIIIVLFYTFPKLI